MRRKSKVNPARGPKEKFQKFLVDTNVFVAAVKAALKHQRKPNSLTLLLYLINEESIHLIGNALLKNEYRKYSTLSPTAKQILTKLLKKMQIIGYETESMNRCIPYFPASSIADAVHASTCLKENAILISNDTDFDRIKQAAIIAVWSTLDALQNLLYVP